MTTNTMAGRKRRDPALKEYESKTEEILSIASSLPRAYQEKILNDLLRMKATSDPESKPKKEQKQVTCTSLRRSSQTPVKTEKMLAYESPQMNGIKSRKRQQEASLLNIHDGNEEEEEEADKGKKENPVKCKQKHQNKKQKLVVKKIKKEIVSDEDEAIPEQISLTDPEQECIKNEIERNSVPANDAIEETPCDVSPECIVGDESNIDEQLTHVNDGLEKENNACKKPDLPATALESLKKEISLNDSEAFVEYSEIHLDEDATYVEEPVTSKKNEENRITTFQETQMEDVTIVKDGYMYPCVQSETQNETQGEKTDHHMPKRRRKPKNGSSVDCHYCPECNEAWPTRNSLRVHLLTHRKPCKCEICGLKFRYQHAYDKHISLHNSGDIIKCPHCAKVIKGKDRLEKHIQERHVQQINIKKKYHSCPQCEETFRSVQKLIKHQQEIHGKSHSQCPICGRRFQYQDRYDRHIKEHEDGLLTQCEFNSCIFHYKTQEEYETHVSRIHKKNAPRPHMCHICSQSFTEARYLKAHLKVHKKDKKFACEDCMFETHTLQALKVHLEQKHSITIAHICDICGTKLASKLGLQDHLKRHYNQRDYVCEICSKAFVAKCQLVSHRKTHLPPQFICMVCEKGFVNKYKLANHMLTHSQVKEFKCPECSFKCNLKSNLYKHMERLHHVKHPDKFSRYKYVQKLNETTVGNEMGSLEIVDSCEKFEPTKAIVPDQIVQLQGSETILHHDGYEVTEQTEAAEVLAQMQSGQTLVKLEQPEQLQVVTEIASQHEEIVLEEPVKTDGDEEVIRHLSIFYV